MAKTTDRPPPGDSPAAATGEQGEARQFVTFHIGAELFAVPLAEVQEIIRMPAVVQLPLSPSSLDGLANLRGAVLPISSLRRIFHLDALPYDDATRVVIINRGQAIGFVVDRMSSVITVEREQIEGVEGINSTVRTEFLSGVIKADAGMILVLDPGQLFAAEFSARKRREGGGAEGGGEGAQRAEAADEIQLVSFEVADQEYALPIEQVQEIVQVPSHISHIPKSDRHVIGVMTLRNRLLPLVSLRRMFALEAGEIGEHNRIVVVALGTAGSSVGVVMDTVKEVLRVPRSLVDPVPNLLSRGGTSSELEAICRLSEGKRLVSILSAERMFPQEVVNQAMEAQGEQDSGEPMADTSTRAAEAGTDDEEQFVVFRLANEEYGVPIDSIQEIVRVPDQLTHMPRTPAFIEGVVNLRGSVLPVIDQRRRFGLADMERNDRQRIMVFTIDGLRTGFIVDSVSEVLKIPRAAIERAPDLTDEQARLVSRVANLERQKRMILLLDVSQLLSGQEMSVLAEAAE